MYLNWKPACRSAERSINSPCIIFCCSFSGTLGITLAIIVISVVMLDPLAAVWILYGQVPVVRRVASPILPWEVLSLVLYWVAWGRPWQLLPAGIAVGSSLCVGLGQEGSNLQETGVGSPREERAWCSGSRCCCGPDLWGKIPDLVGLDQVVTNLHHSVGMPTC